MITSAFQQKLADYPSQARSILNHLKHQQGRLNPEQTLSLAKYFNISREALLIKLLPLAAALSNDTIPVSNFPVGVIVEGYREQGDGPLYFGANLETAGQPLKMSIHAEQAAICNAWSQGETRIRRLAVNEAPCGHCRQFLNELNKVSDTEFIISRPDSRHNKVYTITELLPASFGPDDLNQKERLLLSAPVVINLPAEYHQDALAMAAAKAASLSYAPYSSCHGAVALKLKDGRIITGRYAENAAFNPSMQAIESALVNWRLATLETPCPEIIDGLLIEKGGVVQHRATTASILAGFNVDLRYIAV